MAEEVEVDVRRDVRVGGGDLEVPDRVRAHEAQADVDRPGLQGEGDEVEIDLILDARARRTCRRRTPAAAGPARRRRRRPPSTSGRASGGRAGCARRPAARARRAMPWRSSTSAGPMPERWRIDRAADRARREHDDVGLDALARREDHRAGAAVDQLDAVDGHAGAQLEVGARRGAGARYVMAVLWRTPSTWLTGSDPAPIAPGRVEILDERVAGLRARVEERVHDRPQALAGEAADRHRAVRCRASRRRRRRSPARRK